MVIVTAKALDLRNLNMFGIPTKYDPNVARTSFKVKKKKKTDKEKEKTDKTLLQALKVKSVTTVLKMKTHISQIGTDM